MKLSTMFGALALSALLAAGTAQGTAQEPDTVIVDGKEEALYTNPLSDWLAFHPGVLPKGDSVSSGNWRGYVATWEIVGGKLWLRRVGVTFIEGTKKTTVWGNSRDKKGRLVTNQRVEVERPNYVDRDVRAQMFPGQSDIVADWYTGTLILPKGEVVNYVHMGYGSTYERYTVILVRHGEVTRRLDLRADQFLELRKERFAAFKQTDGYKEQLADVTKRLGAKGAEDFLFQYWSERYLSIDPEAAVN